MTNTKIGLRAHPTEFQLASFLNGSLGGKDRERLEEHIASCPVCLEAAVSGYESVELFNKKLSRKIGKDKTMKKLNIYLILAMISFALSFGIPRYFIQFLVATLLLGIKWVVDSKTTRMLIMIHDAWKKGGEKEASRILETMDAGPKNRL